MKEGRLNSGPDHLSRIEIGEEPMNIEYGLRCTTIESQDGWWLLWENSSFFGDGNNTKGAYYKLEEVVGC